MNDSILEYSTVLDTAIITPSEAVAKLMNEGVLDAYFILSGNGEIRIHVLLKPEKEDAVRAVLQEISRSPVTAVSHSRTILSRKSETIETPYGEIRRKTACGNGITKSKLEFDDIKKISLEQGKSIREIRDSIRKEEQNV